MVSVGALVFGESGVPVNPAQAFMRPDLHHGINFTGCIGKIPDQLIEWGLNHLDVPFMLLMKIFGVIILRSAGHPLRVKSAFESVRVKVKQN